MTKVTSVLRLHNKIRDFHSPEHPYQIRKYLFNSLELKHIFETFLYHLT